MPANIQINRRHFIKALAVTAGGLHLPRRSGAAGISPSSQAAGTFLNPIIKGDYPDPSIVRVGERYYLTHSANTYCPAFLIWKSENLVDWKPVGCALTDYDGDLWAPDLAYHQGKFYLYYITSGGNRVMVADRPEGPWSKPVDLRVPHIDPGHLATPDGSRYLYLSGGHVVELAADGLSTKGPVVQVMEPWPIPEDWRIECTCLEGPKAFYRDGYYHLLVAQGGTAGPATSHMAVHARSKTPFGPWEYSPFNPIVHTRSRQERWWSRGHATAVEAADGSWWLVYHAYEKDYYTLGRNTLLEPLEWTSDGWFCVPGWSDPASPLKRPPGKVRPVELDHSDDFTAAQLNPLWRFWKESGKGNYRTGNGVLELVARGDSPGTGRILTRITGDKAYRIEVEVEVKAQAEGGLMLYYSPECFIGLSLDSRGVNLHSRGRRLTAGAGSSFGRKCGTLRIVNRYHDVSLAFCPRDGEWSELPTTYETSGYNHNVFGGFLDLRMALFASGTGKAHFRNLKYQTLT
jgi:beta-xylosidase